ncbi:MAG: hypothetical protein KC502_05570 [Myxococcales bacterium]|nr:hypothetical protein [Myxococcales bacterium]
MRRQLIGIVVGVAAIAIAAAVGAKPKPRNASLDAALQSQAAVRTMSQRLKDARVDYEQARKAGDIGKMNCVSEPLKLLQSVTKLAQLSLVDLQGAQARRRKKQVKREYIKISTLLSKAETYYGQLKGCSMGHGTTVPTGVQIEKKVSPGIPKVNASEGLTKMPATRGYVSSVSPFYN